MKKLFITSILLFIFAVTSFAQQHGYLLGFAWEPNFPKNSGYLNKTSFRGGKFEYRYYIKKEFSVGLAMNWATYEQYFPPHTYEKADGTMAINGDFLAQAYQFPLTATAHYYFHESKILKPYAGIAIGGQYMKQSLFYNVYESDDDNWGFVVRPEIGTIIQPKDWGEFGFIVGAHYSYATNKNAIVNKDNFQNIGLTLGVVLNY